MHASAGRRAAAAAASRPGTTVARSIAAPYPPTTAGQLVAKAPARPAPRPDRPRRCTAPWPRPRARPAGGRVPAMHTPGTRPDF
ncbi:hypothetical protein G6F66_015575 [Rhizopus arrhizus]|nr:hypothetical protein G6F66_015575 [Rhizopus arrhizus]